MYGRNTSASVAQKCTRRQKALKANKKPWSLHINVLCAGAQQAYDLPAHAAAEDVQRHTPPPAKMGVLCHKFVVQVLSSRAMARGWG